MITDTITREPPIHFSKPNVKQSEVIFFLSRQNRRRLHYKLHLFYSSNTHINRSPSKQYNQLSLATFTIHVSDTAMCGKLTTGPLVIQHTSWRCHEEHPVDIRTDTPRYALNVAGCAATEACQLPMC